MFLKKSIVALTGLFLCIFLIVHLSANSILLLPEDIARGMYNSYSTTLRESPFIKLVAYLLYFMPCWSLFETERQNQINILSTAIRKTVRWHQKIWEFLGHLF